MFLSEVNIDPGLKLLYLSLQLHLHQSPPIHVLVVKLPNFFYSFITKPFSKISKHIT